VWRPNLEAQTVSFGTNGGPLTLQSWDGYRRSGVTLAMHQKTVV